jgi:transcriptional regulator with XRE-family HTH domain
MRDLTQNDVIQLIKSLMQAEEVTQHIFAKNVGISEPFLSMILSGQRQPTGRVLDYLGLRRVKTITYRRTP